MIGKQGTSYRAHRNEAFHTLEDKTGNHGNFLEMILLLANFDTLMDNHLKKAIKESKKRKDRLITMGKAKSRGRGNLVTLLSKSTVNMIVDCISSRIRSKIVDEMGNQKFSLQIDGTMDTSAIDQATIVVRYVSNEDMKERLLAVREITGSKGEEIFKLLESTINTCGLDMKNVVGESFDGAANMRSERKGVQKFIKEVSPNSVYIWCYAHTLNLSATDIVENILPVKSLIGLLQSTATFFSTSCKRMTVWQNMASQDNIGSARLKRLQQIGETRWWSKQAALERILGTFTDPLKGTYCTLIRVLNHVKSSVNFNSKATNDADDLLQKWLRYDTMVTAFLLLRVYSILQQASDYLQTKGLDYLSAWKMVEEAKSKLCKIELNEIKDKVQRFINTMNEELVETDVEIEIEFQKRRVPRKKIMPGEVVQDEIPDDALQRFRMEVFRPVIDQITNSLTERFSANSDLIKDTACFDPNRFPELSKTGVPVESLEKVASLVGVSATALKIELSSFISVFKHLSKALRDEFQRTNIAGILDDDMDDEETTTEIEPVEESVENISNDEKVICKRECKKCLVCCYKILYRYSLNAPVFSNLFLAYEYLLTLSFTQVSCERAFSKLKQIKTRLRSSVGNEKLEAFMLMGCERDHLESVSIDEVTRYLSQKSSVFGNMFYA